MFMVPIKKKTGHFILLGQAQEKSIVKKMTINYYFIFMLSCYEFDFKINSD